ncbi:hypothetical protein [Vibrio phage vB_VmeM-Yong XC32]|nr:hypothetical protein [Vibrio phage vB_VmeM-Yong XC31]QAX96442.1 hypothetical protein [Vibrio phage vB_VmeM-Yong XC32]QAX96759.1 hypothetical protein [Vibrio phage vB_VmeM-Yong MS31]QAX97078.1 hypothetical protein [Vibrio phage vB_VmeM-Yong MS32]
MFKDKSLEAAMQLGTSLAASNITLSLNQNTHLDLVHSSLNAFMENDSVVDQVRQAAMPINVGFDPHTGEKRRVAQLMANRASANLKMARTVVNPLVRAIVGDCENAKRAIEGDSPLNIGIRSVAVLPTFTSPELATMYEKYRVGAFRPVELSGPLRSKILGGLTDDLLFEGLKRGNEVWNTGIKQAMGEGANLLGFTTASEILLRNEQPESNSPAMFNSPINLLNFLFLDALLNNSFTNVSLNDITVHERTELAKARAYFGNRLADQIRHVTEFNKSGKFIIPNGSNNKEVFVYAKNYTKWLDGEGEAEALIGALASGRETVVGVSEALMKDPSKYTAEYRRIESSARTRQRLATVAEMKGVIERGLYNHIHSEVEKDQVPTYIARAQGFFGKHPLQSNADIGQYVREAVCVAIVPNSACLQLLNDMDAFMEDDETLTRSQAGVRAMVRLLGQWAGTQMTVTKSTAPEFDLAQL